MMDNILTALGLLFKLFAAYFVIIGLFALRRSRPVAQAAPKTRFACLVAARNEERVIAGLVESLKAQDYPAELYDIFVIPNNCTDGTEAAAKAAGARILHCDGPVRCKGDALHQAIGQLLGQDYDAFCVFDADNLADPQFLARMNDAFCAGAKVAKGSIRVKNPGDSAVACCYGMYFVLSDLFYNRARSNLGLSTRIVGTGFAVHRQVLEAMGGWNTETLTEDAEFYADCVLRGYKVEFVPQARTWDEAPTTFSLSLTQRRRWQSGIMQVSLRKTPRLLLEQGTAQHFDTLMTLNAPFFQVCSLVPTLLSFFQSFVNGNTLAFLAAMGLSLGLAYIGCTALAVVLALLGKLRSGKLLFAIWLYPIFMASWLLLNLAGVCRKTRSWQPIPHGNAMRQMICQ